MKKLNLCEVNRKELLTSKELNLVKGGDQGGGSTYCNIWGCNCCCCGPCNDPKATTKVEKCRCTDRSAS